MYLTDPPKFKFLKKNNKKSKLIMLRDKVAPILANNLFPHFTDHSIEHSDRMIGIIDSFIKPIQSKKNKITEDELMILYAACYLHDIGMQYENAGDTETISKLGLPISWEDLSDNQRRDLLREYHHKISAEMVYLSDKPSAPIKFNIERSDKPDCIAALCEVHGVDIVSERYSELTQDVSGIRMKLLAGILRVADYLDESMKRALRLKEKARILMLPVESQIHWWRHYYTEDITFDSERKMIIFHYDFPTRYEDEYEKIVPLIQMPWIEKELSNQRSVFVENGLNWSIEKEVPRKAYSMADKMPDPVMGLMIERIHSRNLRAAENKKLVVLKTFQEAQPQLSRRLSELDTKKGLISNEQYISELAEIAKWAYNLGGKRSSWNILYFKYVENFDKLSLNKQIEIGFWLIRVLLEDGIPGLAQKVCLKLEKIIVSLDNFDEEKEEYFSLKSEVTFSMGDLNGAITAIQEALTVIKHEGKRANLETQLSEFYLLIADLDESLNISTKKLKAGTKEECGEIAYNWQKKLSLHTRKKLVECRVLAMKGQKNNAIKNLRLYFESRNCELSTVEQIALFLLEAEIHFLNGNEKEALEVFRNNINILLNSTDHQVNQVRFIVEDCYCELAINQMEDKSILKFYQLFDLRKLIGINLRDSDSEIAAENASKKGREYEAFPIYWRLLNSAYYSGSWKTIGWASANFSKACLRIGLIPLAAYHSILSLNLELAKDIGDLLLKLRSKEWIGITIDVIINYSNLFKHYNIAASMVERIADAIPDEKLDDVLNWLLKWNSYIPTDLSNNPYFTNLWRTIESIGFRLYADQAQKVVDAATRHYYWTSTFFLREHLVKAVYGCVHALSSQELTRLSKKTLPLAKEQKSEYDYADVLNLLVYIAHRSGDKLRTEIADTLYPKDGLGVDVSLAQVASAFGKTLIDTDGLKELARKVIKQIKLQVQYLNVNEDPKPVMELIFTMTTTHKDQKVVVSATGSRHLDLLIKYVDLLKRNDIDLLIDSILSMINESKNLLSNKSVLIERLMKFAGRRSDVLNERVFETMVSVMLKRNIDSGIQKSIMDSQNPLNPHIIKDNTPDDLKSQALFVLAYFEKNKPGIFGSRLDEHIESALNDSSNVVRKFGLASVREIPTLSERVLMGLLSSTRDADPEVAAKALEVIADKRNLKLESYHWMLLEYSIRLAAKSPERRLRSAAAITILSFNEKTPDDVFEKIEPLKKKLLNDICYSVRSVFQNSD